MCWNMVEIEEFGKYLYQLTKADWELLLFCVTQKSNNAIMG